jgi:hypothetical protein
MVDMQRERTQTEKLAYKVKEELAKHVQEQALEYTAIMLHESGRKAVEAKKVLFLDPKFSKFLEWDELTEEAREGRRIQAKELMGMGLVPMPYLEWKKRFW